MYQARFNANMPVRDICEEEGSLREMFDAILDEAKIGKQPGDRLRVSIDHASLEIPITIHLTDYREITTDEIMER